MEERKAALKEAGFSSQEGAAEALGVSRHTVHRWVQGEDKMCVVQIKDDDGNLCDAHVPIEFGLAIAAAEHGNRAKQKKLHVATKKTCA